MRKILSIIFILLFISSIVSGQSEKKLFKKAYKLFNEEYFDEALPLFLKLDSIKTTIFTLSIT